MVMLVCYTKEMDSIFFLDRINRIFRIFLPGFPEESLENPITLGDK